MPHMCSRTGSDRGDIVLGWLVRLVAVFAVVGVLGFDGISLGVARFAVADTASSAALAAGRQRMTTTVPQDAYDAAYDAAFADNGLNEIPPADFGLGSDGSVTLTVVREVPTLVLHHVPGSEKWLRTSSTATWSP